jgi:DNA-binding CsgD family transcriptional regulator
MPEGNTLSERELEILQLVARGLTNREIGQMLVISPNTVKVHLSNIYEKINVASRTEATLYGIEHGIVDVPGAETSEKEAPTPQRNPFQKYLWVWIAAVAVLSFLVIALATDLIFPEPTPEPIAIADVEERWQELSPMPEARAGMAAAAYDGNIYAIAGEGPEGVSGRVFRYLTTTDAWEVLSDKPTPVADVHGALIGEKIYVPGGRTADGNPTDILEIFDPRADAWEVGAPLPKAISAYAMADFEGRLYLFGGWDGEQALDDVYVYDPQEDVWRAGTPMPTARYDAGAAEVQGKIFVVGGRSNTRILNANESYLPTREGSNEQVWYKEEKLPVKIYGMGAVNITDVVFTFYGITDDQFQNLQMYFSPNDNDWVQFSLTFAGNEPRYRPALVSISEFIYFLGGEIQETPINTNNAYRAIYTIMLPITINQ